MTKNLKILSLPSREYVDRDAIMLHACFQILEDFIAKEKVFEWLDPKAHKWFLKEVRCLSDWWQERKKTPHGDDERTDDKMLKRLLKIRRCLWT